MRPRFKTPGGRTAVLVLALAALLFLLTRGGGVQRRPPQPTSSPATASVGERPVRVLVEEASAQTATDTSAQGCPRGCAEPPPGCRIKGNISKKTGERIYHLPGQRFYDKTVVSPEDGEAWFCTEDEATANGWRKSKV